MLFFVIAYILMIMGQTNSELALQQLRADRFDFWLDTSSLQDFSTARLEDAFHLGSLLRRRGESGDSENAGESPPLEAHLRRLQGCENSRIAVHSTGSSEFFSTEEVAQKLEELGFMDVSDLGDIPEIRDGGESFPTTSGDRDRCRPRCAKRGHGNRGERERFDSTGRHHDHAHAGTRHDHHHGSDESQETSTKAADAKWLLLSIGLTVIFGFFLCISCRKTQSRSPVHIGEDSVVVEARSAPMEGSAPSHVVSFHEDDGTIQTVEGTPEGWGETTDLPPAFEDVIQSEQVEGKYARLAE